MNFFGDKNLFSEENSEILFFILVFLILFTTDFLDNGDIDDDCNNASNSNSTILFFIVLFLLLFNNFNNNDIDVPI